MKLPSVIDQFFFEPISARGFSLMRVCWAAVTLLFFLFQWKDIPYFYSDAGILPDELLSKTIRSDYRFTLFDFIVDPYQVRAIYIVFLCALVCMMIGWKTRISTIVSVLLLFSFHERNTMILGGGDAVLRTTGFLLVLAPNISGFSLDRARLQWKKWKTSHTLLPEPTMSIWPWRLLLWQIIVLYTMALWYKTLGSMWWNGTAIAAVLHHPLFARFPKSVNDFLAGFAGFTHFVMFWHVAWLGLLIPGRWVDRLLPTWFLRFSLRRWLMLGGLMFHTSIFILLDAGVFSLAIFTAYLGLLRDEDFTLIKNFFNHPTFKIQHSKFIVLYDGHCGLCLRSIFWLDLLDTFDRLLFVDFRNQVKRKAVAPNLSFDDLNRAMHILKTTNKKRKAYLGFDAFRALTWHLPALWIVAPFLYFPGVGPVGRRIYAKIAAGRAKCTHEGCKV